MYTVIASTRRGPLIVATTADQETAEFIAETTWQGRTVGDVTTVVAAPEHTRASHIARCWTDAAGRIYADIIFSARNL